MTNPTLKNRLRPLAERPHLPRPALVLGQRGAAELIARRLKEEGFEPETAGEPLPALADGQALDKLKSILSRFAERSALHRDDYAGAPIVHPGVSVWAERPEIANLGEEFGLDVICPPARVLSLFANKLNLLNLADQLGIPHLVMGFDPIYSTREIERLVYNQALGRQSFPFVLKSVRGGGSFGLFVVQEPADLANKIPLWMEQVRRNLGEVSLFAERYIETARHIVVPFVRHVDGRFRLFPMSDASLQSRYRKIAELCPAIGLGAEVQKQMAAHTLKLAEQSGYVGVGTLEFIVDDSRTYLVEGAARLNTGFHLWETVAGTSAVSWQLSALEGGMPGEEPPCNPEPHSAVGVALRLYAEDSLLQLPQPGEVHEVDARREWRLGDSAQGPRAELDLQVAPGTRILHSDYGMLGTVWAFGENRKQALAFARGVLDQLWIAGAVQTNERFLSELLSHPWVKEGMFHAGFVDEEFLPAVRPPVELLKGFLVVASRAASAVQDPPGAVVQWAVGDQWVKQGALGDGVAQWEAEPQVWDRGGLPGVSGWIRLPDGRTLRTCAFPLSEGKWQVRLGAWVLPVKRVAGLPGSKLKRPPKLLALVHGRVHAVLYRDGAVVPAHEPLVVLDSLGSLVPHAAPVEVRVKRWKRFAEEIVQAGDELAELEIVSKA